MKNKIKTSHVFKEMKVFCWITPRSSHSKLDFTEEIDEEVSLTFSSESKMAREERPLET